MRISLLVPATLSLVGCVAALVTNSTPRQVIIDPGTPRIKLEQAQTMADSECARHKRYAKLQLMPVELVSRHYVFDCVD